MWPFKLDIEKLEAKKNVKGLIKVLKRKEHSSRDEAIDALGRIGDARAVEPLCQALNDSDKWVVRVSAATALGKIGDTRAVEPLCQALNDSDEDVRVRAATALGRIGDARAVEPLCQALNDSDEDVRGEAAEALGKIGDTRAVESLCQVLNDTDDDVCKKTKYSFAKISDAKSNYDIRRKAVEALGRIGDARAVEPLCQALNDGYKGVRGAAAEALELVGLPDNLEALVIYYLIKGSTDKIISLGQSAVEPLFLALDHNDWEIRKRAVYVLGEIGDTRAVEPLYQALNDSDKDVREEAAEALERVGLPDNLEVLVMYYLIKGSTDKIISLGQSAVEPLLQALDHSSWKIRESAVYTLGKIGDARVVEPLCQALDDSNYNVRREALEALGRIGDARAVEPLCQALENSNYYVRKTVAEILVRFYQKKSLQTEIKEKILQYRKKITFKKHDDDHNDFPRRFHHSSDCHDDHHGDRHRDNIIGIGVDFPL